VFPKSRKLVVEGDRAVAPLGWVRLTFKEGEPLVRAAWSSLAPVPPHPGIESGPAKDGGPQSPQPPAILPRDPWIQEAETLIRLLKPHEVKGRIQAVAAAISKCSAEEQGELVECFRKHQEALQFKARDIRANMESLVQRLNPPAQAEGA
jgi:hypothetical protein